MLLAHAKALAAEKVTRNGQEFAKHHQFTKEHFGFEDWEPVVPEWVPPKPPEDCGCAPEQAAPPKKN